MDKLYLMTIYIYMYECMIYIYMHPTLCPQIGPHRSMIFRQTWGDVSIDTVAPRRQDGILRRRMKAWSC